MQRVCKWVEAAVAEGASVPVGGHASCPRIYEPTVLVEPNQDSIVSTAEIFGPVTCVYGFSNLAEAVTRANRLPYAFQAAIFSRDIDAALFAAKYLAASATMINDHSAFRTDWMPFAGWKQSGLGIGGIPYTIKDMLVEKMIVMRHR